MVHAKDGSRIGYEKYSEEEGKQVPADEIVKAYEMKDGELVYLEDSDFEATQTKGYHTIELTDFMPHEQSTRSTSSTRTTSARRRAQAGLCAAGPALERSGLAGVGTFVMRERHYLGCRARPRQARRARADVLRRRDPRRRARSSPRTSRVDKGQLDMAVDLVERLSGDFRPSKYKGTYRDTLMKMIHQKSKGEQVRAPEPEPEEEPQDLMAALMESLERHRSGGESSNGRQAARVEAERCRPGSGLGELSKEELLERAAKADVSGARSDQARARQGAQLASRGHGRALRGRTGRAMRAGRALRAAAGGLHRRAQRAGALAARCESAGGRGQGRTPAQAEGGPRGPSTSSRATSPRPWPS